MKTMVGRSNHETGQVIGGRYLLEGILGRGGFGTVFRALQAPLNRPVAVKICHATTADPEAYTRFEREARIIAGLRSPHTVRLYDFGLTDEGRPFFAMELITGHCLAHEIQLGSIPPLRTARILLEVCESLAEAHAREIVHHDLKPSNIMLERISGRGEMARVLDFGIAWIRPEAGQANEVVMGGGLIGTPRYMAPELFRMEGATAASDLYGVGLVLDECLRGSPTFEITDTPAYLGQHFESVPSAIEGTPPGLAEIRAQLLSPDPGERPVSAGVVREMLAAWIRNHERQMVVPPVVERTQLASRATATTDEFESQSLPPTVSLPVAGAVTQLDFEVSVNLPVHSSRFIGREAELASIASAFRAGGQRLVTLVGTGGAGKSRLSIRHGYDCRRDYLGGVWFCDLLEATSVMGIAAAVAEALGTPLGASEPVSLLGQVLANSGPALVILDNFEQVTPFAAETVGRWLSLAPSVHFLVTSREPLGLAGEHLIRVEPFTRDDAVALFEQHAQVASPRFSLTPDNRAQIESIVEALDCLPLAIELAAARMSTLTLPQLEKRLGERFRVLRARSGSRPRHQANMRAAIEWSWALLTPVERSALAQCSVFRGGFSLLAAETVLDLGGLDEGMWTDEVIAALVDKSLVRRWVPSDGLLRFGLYESIRAFAAEKMALEDAVQSHEGHSLTGGTAYQSLLRRHAENYGRLGTEPALSRQYRNGGVAVFETLRREQDNLWAAFHAAMVFDESTLAAQCAFALAKVLVFQGPVERGRELLATVSELELSDLPLKIALASRMGGMASRAGERSAAGEHWRRALDLCGNDVNHPKYSSLVSQIGMVHITLGEVDEGRKLLLEALRVARVQGDQWDEARSLSLLGTLFQHQSEMPRAGACYDQSLGLFRELGDVYGELHVLCSLGTYYDVLGNPQQAEKVYLEALEMAEQCGDTFREAGLLVNLGLLYMVRGQFAESMRYSRAAIHLARRTGNVLAIAISEGNLGNLYYEMGDLAEARTLLTRALAHCDEGEPFAAGAFRGSLALISAEEGDFDAAASLFDAAEAQLRTTHLGEYGQMICKKGLVALLANRPLDAQAHLNAAQRIALDSGAGEQSELGYAIAQLEAKLLEAGFH